MSCETHPELLCYLYTKMRLVIVVVLSPLDPGVHFIGSDNRT